MKGSGIRIGQTLNIPAAPSIAAASVIKLQAAETDRAQLPAVQQINSRYAVSQTVVRNGKHYGRIQIQPGENLQILANWALLSPVTLQRLNTLTDSTVHPGRSLVLSFDKVSPKDFQKKRLAFYQKTEREFFSAFSVVGLKKYTVATDDTVWEICHKKFTIPIWLLQKYNASKDLTDLRSPMELVIPIVRAI